MINVTTEILDGITYLSTVNSRRNATTVWELLGTIFVQTNRSAPRALQDIAKPSKEAKALVSFLGA